jgi:hypothetical protein
MLHVARFLLCQIQGRQMQRAARTGRVMTNSNQAPEPRPRSGRLIWIAGLMLGVIAGVIVAFELAAVGATVGL